MHDICPNCHAPVRRDAVNAVIHCANCGTALPVVAADTNAAAGTDANQVVADSQSASSVLKSLLYGLSLPERLVRSGVGLAAGIVQESAAMLVPQAFQSSKSYEIAITNSLNFLTENVGGVKRAKAEAAENDAADFVARKTVGNFVDLASLATLHVSPMWILAIASDVAYGTKTYLKELAVELKQQGLIDDDSSIHGIDDVLTSLQNVAGTAASNFDTPPFSLEGLKSAVTETRESISKTDLTKLIPQKEMQMYWEEMRQIANEENVSMLQVSGAITMQTLGKVKSFSHGALTGVRVAGGLMNRNILQHYVTSLRQVHEKGYYASLQETSQPYLAAVWNNFSSSKESWTENLLNPTNIQSRVGKVWGWMTGRKQETGVKQQESGGAAPAGE